MEAASNLAALIKDFVEYGKTRTTLEAYAKVRSAEIKRNGFNPLDQRQRRPRGREAGSFWPVPVPNRLRI